MSVIDLRMKTQVEKQAEIIVQYQKALKEKDAEIARLKSLLEKVERDRAKEVNEVVKAKDAEWRKKIQTSNKEIINLVKYRCLNGEDWTLEDILSSAEKALLEEDKESITDSVKSKEEGDEI